MVKKSYKFSADMDVFTFYVGHNVDGRPQHNTEVVSKAFNKLGFHGYTITTATGVWNGELETSSVVEVALEKSAGFNYRKVAESLCCGLRQYQIMVTKNNEGALLVDRPKFTNAHAIPHAQNREEKLQ